MYFLVGLLLHLPAGKCDLEVFRVIPSTDLPYNHCVLMNDFEMKRHRLKKKSGSAMSYEHNAKENNPPLEQELD